MGEVLPPNTGWADGRFPHLITMATASLLDDVLGSLEIFTLPFVSWRYLGVLEDRQYSKR